MKKGKFKLVFPHHLKKDEYFIYNGEIISIDYNTEILCALTVKAKLDNGDNIGIVLPVPDYNIEDVKKFINTIEDLKNNDKKHTITIEQYIDHAWYIDIQYVKTIHHSVSRRDHCLVSDLFLISLDRHYNIENNDDNKILKSKREEYVDKYIKEVKDYFGPLYIEEKECEKAVKNFIYKRHYIVNMDDINKLEIQPALYKTIVVEKEKDTFKVTPEETEIVKKLYNAWSKHVGMADNEYDKRRKELNKKYNIPETGWVERPPNEYYEQSNQITKDVYDKYPYAHLNMDPEEFSALSTFLRYCGAEHKWQGGDDVD